MNKEYINKISDKELREKVNYYEGLLKKYNIPLIER